MWICIFCQGLEAGSLYDIQSRCKNGSGALYNSRSFKFEVTTEPYAALGDSYSSGEGSFNYDMTGLEGEEACHRSREIFSMCFLKNVTNNPITRLLTIFNDSIGKLVLFFYKLPITKIGFNFIALEKVRARVILIFIREDAN
jgi:hypothetical protein